MTPHEWKVIAYTVLIVVDLVFIWWTVGQIFDCVIENRARRRRV